MLRFKENERPHVHVILTNDGETPAWDLRCRFEARLLPFPSEENIIPEDDVSNYGVFGPGTPLSLAVELGPLTADQQIDILRGAKAIYIAGHIEYEDAFGAMHWTTFRHYFGGELGPSTEGVMATAPTGNDADRPQKI